MLKNNTVRHIHLIFSMPKGRLAVYKYSNKGTRFPLEGEEGGNLDQDFLIFCVSFDRICFQISDPSNPLRTGIQQITELNELDSFSAFGLKSFEISRGT